MKRIVITGLLVLSIATLLGLYLYHKPATGIKSKTAVVDMAVDELLYSYNQNESQANAQFLGKVISVHGKVAGKEMDDKGNISILLTASNQSGFVNCLLDNGQKKEADGIASTDSVQVKGVCVGYLFPDVQMNQCLVTRH